MRPRQGLPSIVLLLLWLWLVAACAGAAGRPAPSHGAGAESPVYVTSNGWHTEIVFETATLPEGRWPQRAPFRERRYLEVGWGDRDAYPADRLTARLALRAAFASRGSTLRVAGFDEPIPERFRGLEVVELRLSVPALEALAEFVQASHVANGDGQPARPHPAAAGSPAFFPARGRFHALNTCNTWTARALRAADLPLWPALTFTAHQVMLQVVPLGRIVATGPA